MDRCRKPSRFGRIISSPWATAINWAWIFPARNVVTFPTARSMTRSITSIGTRGTIISIAIGQGEILTTPLQICNFAATVANRGYFITPHVVKVDRRNALDSLYTHRRYTKVERRWYEYIAAGMRASVTGTAYGGTSRGVALPDIEVCGKTGTAENPHGKDHSVSWASHRIIIRRSLSPYSWRMPVSVPMAVPIARLMLNKYFHGDKATGNEAMESRIENTVILPSGAI